MTSGAQRCGVVACAPVSGGAEAYLRNLYGALTEFGIEGELLGQVARWDESGRPAHALPLGPKWSRRTALRGVLRAPRERRAAAAAVERLHAERPFALFHAQYKREQILMSGPLSRLAPVLWTEQGRFPDRRGTGPLRAAYARAARHVGAIVCVSDAVRADVADICGPRGPRLEVIPNPVDTERFRPPSPGERAAARGSLGVPSGNGPVFVTSGRLHPAKQIDLAIQAAAGVDGAHLVVAGDGPDRERLQGLANGHVTFTGRVDRPELVYAAGDAFVLPSSASAREGLSLAMLEAAASGLPVVTVEGSGMEEHASAGGGLVADPEPGSLAEALELAAALPGDRPREWVAAFDLRSCARRHADLMRELIAEGAR